MSKKITDQEFKQRVYNLVGAEYLPITNYISNNNKVTFLHSKCNSTFDMTPVHFYRGQRCSNCFKCKKKDSSTFSKEVIDLGKNEYRLKSEYVNNNTYVKIKHLTCNNTYNVRPSNFIQGYRCPYCFKNKTKDTATFSKEVIDLGKNEYRLKSEYVNNKTKVEIQHLECNKLFLMRPNDFISGHRCPHCSTLPHESKGVKLIKNYLESNKIKFIMEYRFSDCKYYKTLPFDFYLPDKNILIEFDGKQHFIPMESFGGLSEFKKTKIRDSIKTNYCKNNNIPLLRISYDMDINLELNNFLNESSTTIETT